ncbi:ABC-2 type transport system permease protein [Paracoccus halophilus]|uniref:ABC-2 type transport system permease protein n=1 Tax=Paracoccus halophilus TaxID=376733 RepID=A0A099F8T3_9RHOB|nr:ABC transporter permease [Paracoccus halophilus]KGJ06638.1 membrane protein [Paracoccus halophilus]SFA42528.1 ABC-2 type transport system permease protein [Paracoccus halophilus]
MKPRNVWHLGIKELRGLWRDPAMLVLIIYAFTLSIYTESKAMPESLSDAAIAIVDEDRSMLSGRIASAFAPPYFVAPRLITTSEMDSRMDEGLETFALNIPLDFERDVLAGRAPAIQLNVDATRMSQAFTGSGYVQQIVTAEVSEFVAGSRESDDPPVELVLRARYNPPLDAGWFGAINSVIDAITMLSIILTGAALIREKEHGTVEHLLVMPVSAAEIMLSKIWSMGLVVLLASGFAITVVVQMALQVPVQGSVLLFVAAAALMLFATTSTGIFLATVAGTMPQFGLLLMLVLLPLQVLSGGMTPRESMPDIIQWIMSLAPTTHFVILSQGILFRGAGLDVVWPQLLALAAIGAALFWLALRQFRRFLS